MKFKLNAKDRLIIPRLLPEEGTLISQTVVKEIIEKVKLEAKDFSKYGITENHTTGTLDGLDGKENPKVLEDTEYDLNKAETDTLKEAVEAKDKDGKINQAILETCRKIKKMR